MLLFQKNCPKKHTSKLYNPQHKLDNSTTNIQESNMNHVYKITKYLVNNVHINRFNIIPVYQQYHNAVMHITPIQCSYKCMHTVEYTSIYNPYPILYGPLHKTETLKYIHWSSPQIHFGNYVSVYVIEIYNNFYSSENSTCLVINL